MSWAQDMVALVTGAGGEAGRGHALRLAAAGMDIIAVDGGTAGAPGAGLDETARMVRALGRRVAAAPADVRDHGQLAAAVNRAAGELGRLDVVVAAAGGLGRQAAAGELTEAAWQDMIDVNLTGAWLTCKVAVPHIIAGGRGGSVVLAGSVAAVKPYPGLAHYVAAEHAIVGLARTLAQELGADGIRVNVLLPDGPAAGESREPLLPSPARPRDASEALLFLISDVARHITGVALPVDAGVLAR